MVAEQFQEKNKTRFCKDDALSKQHMHTKMKVTDPVKNEEPLQKQRLYKMEYRKKIKAKILSYKSLQHQHQQVLKRDSVNDQPSCNLVERLKTLPKSLRKQKSCCNKFGQKINLKIAPQPSNKMQKQQDFTDNEQSCLREFCYHG